MKVTIIQLDIEWGNPQKNIDRTEKLMQETAGAGNIYCFPPTDNERLFFPAASG